MEEPVNNKKIYEKPVIITYTEEELLDIIGPAQTSGSPHGLHLGWGIGKGNPHR